MPSAAEAVSSVHNLSHGFLDFARDKFRRAHACLRTLKRFSAAVAAHQFCLREDVGLHGALDIGFSCADL